MATVSRYVRTANTSAAHNNTFGALVGGGGAGTSGSPYSTWAQLMADLEDTATDHSADDFVAYLHPAAYFAHPGGTDFDVWTDLCRGNSWKSITLRRWDDIVTGDSRYATWYPSFDSHKNITSGQWTQGFVSGSAPGSWSAGAGPVYKFTGTIPATADDPAGTQVWGGHEVGDTTGTYTIAGTFCLDFSDMTEPGDFCLVDLGATCELYVYADNAQNPTQKWGSFSYQTNDGSFSLGLMLRNCRNLTFQDIQAIGAAIVNINYNATSGEANENLRWTRPRHRMGSGRNGMGGSTGQSAGTGYTNYIRDVVIDSPDFVCGSSPRPIKGAISNSYGSQNGISIIGRVERLTIYDPMLSGYSHAHIQCHPENVGLAESVQWPKDVNIIVRDAAKGRIACNSNIHSCGLNLLVPVRCWVGPVRISGQTSQSQFNGDVTFTGYFDSTCPAFSDPYGSSNRNLGNHISITADGPYNVGWTTQNRIRLLGARFDNAGEHLAYWYQTLPASSLSVIGCLIRDRGQVRYLPQQNSAISAAYTRRRAPFLGTRTNATNPNGQEIRRNWFQLDAGAEGIASKKTTAGTAAQNADQTNWPIVTVGGAETWSGLVSDNVQGTLAEFGFDSDMNYIGARQTPVQTGPRSGRGYR